MKYKVNDQVRVKSLEELKEQLDVVLEMEQYAGQLAIVTEVLSSGRYRLNIDHKAWSWKSDMLDDPACEWVRNTTASGSLKYDPADGFFFQMGAHVMYLTHCPHCGVKLIPPAPAITLPKLKVGNFVADQRNALFGFISDSRRFGFGIQHKICNVWVDESNLVSTIEPAVLVGTRIHYLGHDYYLTSPSPYTDVIGLAEDHRVKSFTGNTGFHPSIEGQASYQELADFIGCRKHEVTIVE